MSEYPKYTNEGFDEEQLRLALKQIHDAVHSLQRELDNNRDLGHIHRLGTLIGCTYAHEINCSLPRKVDEPGSRNWG